MPSNPINDKQSRNLSIKTTLPSAPPYQMAQAQPVHASTVYTDDESSTSTLAAEPVSINMMSDKTFTIDKRVVPTKTDIVLYYKLHNKSAWNNVKLSEIIKINVKKEYCCYKSEVTSLNVKASLCTDTGDTQFFIHFPFESERKIVPYNEVVTFDILVKERSMSDWFRLACCPPLLFCRIWCNDDGKRKMDFKLGNF